MKKFLLKMVQEMIHDCPHWVEYRNCFDDYIINTNGYDFSEEKKALISIGSSIYKAIRAQGQGSVSMLSSSALLYDIWDPYNKYGLNYDAYRFVAKIMADVIGVGIDVAVESVGENLLENHLGNAAAAQLSPDMKRLEQIRSRLLDFSRGNQLVNFKKFEKSCIEIKYPISGDLLSLLCNKAKNDRDNKVYIEHWSSLGFMQISECSECGNYTYKPYRGYNRKEGPASTRCQFCSEQNKKAHTRTVKEHPIDIALTPLRLVCSECQHENNVIAPPDGTKQICCDMCGANLKLPSYPIFSSANLPQRKFAYVISTASDTATKRAAERIKKRTRELESHFG